MLVQRIFSKFKILKGRDIIGFFKLGITFIPGRIYSVFNKNVWMITELKENARDNGYWLFKYVRENCPDVQAFYPILKTSSDYKFVEALGNTVEFGSLTHFMLFWASKKYIGTTKEHGFPDERTCEFFINRKMIPFKYVFLNHGFARGYSGIVNAHKTKYDMICAMCKREKEIIVNINDQPEEKVSSIGFCRHDNLNDDLLDKRCILFMPTWRRWLDYRHETDKEIINQIKEEYFQSKYYNKCMEIIKSEKIIKFLEEKDLYLVMYLHGYAQEYSRYFVSDSDRIIVAHKDDMLVQDLLKTATFLITDYSSVYFDYAYMKKPMVYYQYDKEEFSEKQYSESEFYTYENDGFGPIVYNFEDLLYEIERSYNTGFIMDDKYLDRVNCFFDNFDNNHCEQIYKLIEEL